jgi:hypothetical protein
MLETISAIVGARPSRQMRLVAKRFDRFEHPLPGQRADPPAIAQHVRHRGRRATGTTRDFAQCRHGLFTVWSLFGTFSQSLHPSERRGTICRTDRTISETLQQAIDPTRSIFFGFAD